MTSTFAAIPIPTEDALTAAVERAVSWGARAALYELDREREMTPTALLASAAHAAYSLGPNAVMLQAQVAVGPVDVPVLTETLDNVRGAAAASLRLALRALQVDARNAAIRVGDRLVGYEIDRWLDAAVNSAQVTVIEGHDDRLSDDQTPTPAGVAKRAHDGLCRAIVGCEQDRMSVAERISEALGDLLVIFVLADGLRNR
jgi:hypothetical protein